MTQAEMMKAIEDLKAQNEALKARVDANKKVATITLKIAEKSGALSAYGLGRFPVTLYREQWTRLMDRKDDILAFIENNKNQLSSKENKAAA